MLFCLFSLLRIVSGAALTALEVMPDAQDDESSAMRRVADDVRAKDEVTDCIRLWSLRDTTPHLGECAKAVHASDEVGSDACGRNWIVGGDEGTKTGEIGDGLL